jgi:hypothetical protein
MAYKKAPKDHSEFGGGAGMLDAIRRKDARDTLSEEQLWEIYATDPADPNADPTTSVIERP